MLSNAFDKWYIDKVQQVLAMCDDIWKSQEELEAARARLVQAKIKLRRLGVDVEQIDELFEQALNEVEVIYDYSDNLRDALREYIEARLNIV